MQTKLFNKDWSVSKKGGAIGLQTSEGLKKVDLPYDALIYEKRSPENVGSFRSGYYPNGVWEFKKKFFVPEDAAAQKWVFRFDGVYAHSSVYINGDFAGGRASGYTCFYVDTDGLLKYGQENEITVIARSTDDARWYSGCGIYRDVHLLTSSRVHIAPEGSVIATPKVEREEAAICVSVPMENRETLQKTLRIEAVICDQKGTEAARGSAPLTVAGGSTATARLNIYLSDPQLWSVDDPALYCCSIRVSDQEGIVLDTENLHFGLRSICVDPVHGFRINERTIKLRGACIHHDNGPLGAISTAFIEERRIRKLKDAGFNAIRCAHNPASQALLDACDRLGMLVMNEVFDAWTQPKVNFDYSVDFDHHWQEDVDAFVRSSVNHPSVILYSIGNEIPETGSPNGAKYGRAITARIKALDPGRPTLNSVNGMMSVMSILESLRDNSSAEQQGGDINQQMTDLREIMSQIMRSDLITYATEEAYANVDVAGYNYMDVRYENDHVLFPNRVICGTETYPPRIAHNWGLIAKCPHVIGDFTWTGWDYLGESGIGLVKHTQPPLEYGVSAPYPSLTAACGDLSICGERRPISYYREIVFGLRKEPYIAVIRPESADLPSVTTPWSWSDSIGSWNFPEYEGKPVAVEIYSDAEEVALLLNGKEITRAEAGEKHDYMFRFTTPYFPGTLEAVAIRSGLEAERFALHTETGKPRLHAETEKRFYRNIPGEFIYIAVSIVGETGAVCPCFNPKVSVSAEGCAEIISYATDEPCPVENFFDLARTLYDGHALLVLRPTGTGQAVVSFSSEGCETEKLTVKIEAPDA
jgi:beta-galactosidase